MEDIINFLKIGKINVIGSYTDKNRRYYSDIDIDDLISTDIQTFFSMLKYKLKTIINDPNFYFIESKAGMYGGKPIKWTLDEILDGYRYIDNKKVDLLGTLFNASNVKIDLIILDKNNNLLPVTVSYKFKDNLTNTQTGYASTLYLEAQRNVKQGNEYEAYKKLYLYYKDKGDMKHMNDMLDVLNSKTGLTYTKLHKLKEIKRLLDSDNKYSFNIIQNNLKDIQNGLPSDISFVMIPLTNSVSLDSIKSNINKAISAINAYINNKIKNLN